VTVATGLGRSLSSSALRRSTNVRISHFSLRLLLVDRTVCSLSNNLRQAKCGSVMRTTITNGHQIFHVNISAWSIIRLQTTRVDLAQCYSRS
jgi:hypothetical protein